MSEFLDELARALARPMPRSRALRVLGAVLVAAAVPGGFTRSARGGTRAFVCPGCGLPAGGNRCVSVTRSGRCSDNPRFPVCCKWPGIRGEQGFVGGGLCTSYVDSQTGLGGSVCCCPTGYTCGRTPNSYACVCPPCGRHGHCCKEDETCRSWLDRSPGNSIPYPREQDCLKKCTEGRRCKLSHDCCPAPQDCCPTVAGDERCCELGDVCRQGVVRLGSDYVLTYRCRPKCHAPNVRCNFVCCPPGQRAFRKIRAAKSPASLQKVEVIQCVCVSE